MLEKVVAFRVSWFACALLSCACGAAEKDSGSPAGTGDISDISGISGHFAGHYEVPVEPALAAAATYPIRKIEWRVRGGEASLSYDLPVELLGRSLAIELDGPTSESTAKLSGKVAVADCEISPAKVVCTEDFAGLSPLRPDLDAVSALAKDTYAGPAQDRVHVAQLFAADPIGIVHIELDTQRDD